MGCEIKSKKSWKKGGGTLKWRKLAYSGQRTAVSVQRTAFRKEENHRFMRFILIDRIISLEAGREIKAVKNVSLAEEYLADHFPAFPVLPGVLLLEGLVESASWLVRETENFAHSMVLLKEARNVKYRSFLEPGSRIEYTVTAKTIEESVSSFDGFGSSNGERIVEAKFGLRHFNLADEDSGMAAVDVQIIENMKQRWKLLR